MSIWIVIFQALKKKYLHFVSPDMWMFPYIMAMSIVHCQPIEVTAHGLHTTVTQLVVICVYYMCTLGCCVSYFDQQREEMVQNVLIQNIDNIVLFLSYRSSLRLQKFYRTLLQLGGLWLILRKKCVFHWAQAIYQRIQKDPNNLRVIIDVY